jgi:hypothetical protein
MAAGYSKKPLAEKLGIKEEGCRIIIMNPPRDYLSTLEIPPGAIVASQLKGPLHFIQFFTKVRKELEVQFPGLKRQLLKSGMIWICWPKGSSKVETDLNEGIVREIGLRNGLVDVKVCAVDEVWSGLKFVYRKEDRKS